MKHCQRSLFAYSALYTRIVLSYQSCSVMTMVKDYDLNAGKIIREAAKLIQGGGGGQPHYAQAGGKNADSIRSAVDKVIELISL